MKDTVRRWLSGIAGARDRESIRQIVEPIADRLSTQSLSSAGLAIHGASSALVKTGGSDWYCTVQGKLVKIASATDLPALSGSITANKYNVYCFFVDGAGTKTSSMGTEGTTIADVKFPTFPQNKALIGFVLVTHTSTFVGGSTNLDAAGVTVVYSNPIGPFDPSIKLA